MSETRDRLYEHVTGARDHLERLFRIITEPAVDDIAWLKDEGANVDDITAEVAALDDPDDIDEVTLGRISDLAYEFLGGDILDVTIHGERSAFSHDYTADWTVTGLVILLTCGGPHIELNTRTRTFDGWWGGAEVKVSADSDLCDWAEGMWI